MTTSIPVFEDLLAHYPETIAQMPETFNSHQFILKLAQQHQVLYIESLHRYCQGRRAQGNDPFRNAHKLLAKLLRNYEHLVEFDGYVASPDIFNQPGRCARWRKIEASRPR